jgi:SecD/SecF fusion protein
MNGKKVFWQLALTVLVFWWAIVLVTPVKDTPFDTFVVEQVQANKEDFNAFLAKAQAKVKDGSTPSVYVAMSQVARDDRVDVGKFFPQYKVTDVPNLDKKNGIILREILRRSQGKMRLGLDLAGGVSVTFKANDAQLASDQHDRSSQMDKAREIITKRVDSLGVAEPIIRVKGGDAIEVQMPGVSTKDNPDIIGTIGKPALLEFCLVSRDADPRSTATAPIGFRLMSEERSDPKTGQIYEIPLYVKSIPEMTGKSISDARAVIGSYGEYMVTMNFTPDGKKRFSDITTRMAQENEKTNTTGQLAIVLDGKLQSSPTVREPITGGSAQITGNFSQREAQDLANVLSNPLEVGLHVDEQSEVGSNLAADAKDASFMAGIIGCILVIVFMVGYYWWSGIVAVIAMSFNILITIAGMCYIGATLTLPGVAGLVLTVGMAVDANILILERVREELEQGKNHIMALDLGYKRAFMTIIDCHITTILTALLLAWLGSGPVKGFGITLALGIIGTLFCVLVVSQMMMEFLVGKGILKRMLGSHLFGKPNFHFMKYRWPAIISSSSLIVIGMVCVVIYWNNIFGVDFTGGDEVTMSYSGNLTVAEITKVSEMSVDQIRKEAATTRSDKTLKTTSESYDKVLAKGEFGEVNAAFTKIIGTSQSSVKVQARPGMGLAYAHSLSKAYPNSQLKITGVIQIGPSVGQEVAKSSVWAVLFALLGICVYIALRFEWGYGFGAVVATAHDGLMTVGMFVFLGNVFGIGTGQFNESMIASILMVLGYSVNDTIVVFDRIREELKLNPTMHLAEVIDLSVNLTLSRTVLTSATTFLATLALFLFGAGVVVDYALIFLIGIITGTFSSIYIASPIFFWYHNGLRAKVEEHNDKPVYEWEAGSAEKTQE